MKNTELWKNLQNQISEKDWEQLQNQCPLKSVEIRVIKESGKTSYECPEKSLKKDSPCAHCICQKMSNYEIAKRNTQKGFYKENHAAIAEKLQIPYNGSFLYIDFMNRHYRVNCRTGLVEWSEDQFHTCYEADFNEVMTLYDILCYSREGAAPSGTYTLLHHLSTVKNGSSAYAGSGLFAKKSQEFDHKTKLLEDACEKMGGHPYGKGDVSYRIPFYRDLSLILSFWDSDEDFPAELQIFLDTNTLQYMHYETTWYMVSHLLERMNQKGQ